MVSTAQVSAWSLHHLNRLWASDASRLTDPDLLLGHAQRVRQEFDGVSPIDEALHFDIHMLLPFCYNVKVDVATMMNSLEARSPFQDREVVEWAARIDPGLKLRAWEKKHLLKRAAAQRVPRDVVYRPKHGFSIPLETWFCGSWASAAHEIILGPTARARGLFNYDYIERLWVEHQARRARHGTRFWLLLWLELWFRMFVDRSMTASDPMPGD
jgi:asparagine synthase (glutamine-hydrolysing)